MQITRLSVEGRGKQRPPMGCENNLDDDLEVPEIGSGGQVRVRGLEGIGYFPELRVRVCVCDLRVPRISSVLREAQGLARVRT